MKKRADNIKIYKHKLVRYRVLFSSSTWFDNAEWFVINDDEQGCLTIKKCYMEIPKNAQKKATNFQFVSDLPLGTFNFDEDSTEDKLIIYYLE